MSTPVHPRPAPTVFTGYRDPVTNILADRKKVEIGDKIHLWEPEASPLLLLTQKIKGGGSVGQSKFQWIEKEPYPRELIVNGAQLVADTSIEVTDGTPSANSYVYLNRRTREVLLVTAGGGTNTLTVTRAVGGVASAMNDGDKLELIGAAHEDGTGKGSLKSVKESIEYNVCQIFKRTYGFSGRQMHTALYGGKDPVVERKVQAIEHKKDIELAAFFGKRYEGTGTNSRELHLTAGMEFFIKSNVLDFGGNSPSYEAILEWLESAMRFGDGGHLNGSGTKYLFASRKWITQFAKWAHDKMEYVQDSDVLGVKIKKIQTPHGDLMLVPQNIFFGEHSSYAFLLDMNHIFYRYYEGRDTALYTDIQQPDYDSVEEEWRTDCGFEVRLEGAHGLIKGLPIA